jgi:hypothetical protein
VAKIKFFRRSGDTLTMFAERGPFDTGGGRTVHNVALSPGVNVQTGDLIAITRMVNCGNALAELGTGSQGYVVLPGDATAGTISAGNTIHDKLALIGTGSAPGDATAGYLAVVGSTAGGFGSNFKTAVQLFNPSTTSLVTGHFVFHRAGVSGSSTDPSLSFSVAPGEVLAIPDVVAAMTQAGLGSMDVVVPVGARLPLIATRIYNDQGTNGTAGFFEDLIDADAEVGNRILITGNQGFLLTPIEPLRTRLNVGVRSLSSGATMNVKLEDSAGNVISNVTKTYPATFFEQTDAGNFVNAPIGANQKIRITMTAGSAIVYGATTDNVTNDPSVQFANAVEQ